MIEIEFPIRRMDWMENKDSLEVLTYDQAVNDIASVLDLPHDCIYTVGELVDVAAMHFEVTGSRILGSATFRLGNLKAARKKT